jgi:hypothetical protein
VPNADEIILTYLRESLKTFRMRCILSSAVCLGCASEQAFDVMLEAYAETLSKDEENRFQKNTEGQPVKKRSDEFAKEWDNRIKGTVDRGLRDSLPNYLGGLFQVIRYQRNDAGHPTGAVIDREQLYATLTAFPSQLDTIYKLIRHFQKNKRK